MDIKQCEITGRQTFGKENDLILHTLNINVKPMIQKTYYKTKDYCKVKFELTLENAESLAVVGLNGDWNTPVLMNRKKDGRFSCDVPLTKNTEHEFKYLVNGKEWLNEPEADSHNPNIFGSNNSVIIV